MSKSYKLLTFNAHDSIRMQNHNEIKEYLIQMFGINEKGETACIFVTGFKPFFFIKVGDDWDNADMSKLIIQIKEDIGEKYSKCIVDTKLLKRKTLYGFDKGKLYNFVLIKFTSEEAYKKTKSLWYVSTKSKGYHLDENGYQVDGEGYETQLYETHIPPLLRMFHIKDINPSGWIELPMENTLIHSKKSTTCKNEYTINYKHLISLKHKETIVPYKIASFDIEASSSHGDFPLAKKNYKKLSTNIVDKWNETDIEHNDFYLKKIIFTAFNILEYGKIDDIELVYTLKDYDFNDISTCYEILLKQKPKSYKEFLMENEDIEEESEDKEIEEGIMEESDFISNNFKKPEFIKKYYKKEGTIINMLNDQTCDRDTKITVLTTCLTKIFPKLKGDEVTFIGTTFIKYGEEKPYLNHCIVKNTCEKLDKIENSEIKCYKSEKEVLLAWSQLITKENPDIIIGYNIFGFDYQFLYTRSCELDCSKKFLQMSRIKKEICISKKWDFDKKTMKEGLEESTIYIASGQHDLKYINMKGRVQIDLYNYLRRDYQLTKYKLDYVAGYFIGDKVSKFENINNFTKIYSKNLSGLDENAYVNFEEEAHSIDSYKDGQKFLVSNINYQEGTFNINSIEKFDMNKKIRWGLAKDDVTPQDIFKMTNEGPKERAIIAKYCIQDCNLVHELLKKIDVITGYVEMANLCSVPLEFLVLRGQGIKLTSYIAKKCREKNTLMPVIDKNIDDDGYEGAIVLEPKCNLYLEEPVACLDYSSLYPSSMISENISHDSKVWTKEYDLEDNLIKQEGELDNNGEFMYDNLKDYTYVDIQYDTYTYKRKNDNPKSAKTKVKIGYKICRFAQFPQGKAIMPSILEELLAARKATRKLIPLQNDDFMKNILDKRQLSIKVTANSMYGQTGAKTSTFYEKDCAASTTAMGRKLLIYGQTVIETAYKNKIFDLDKFGIIKTNAEYVYGDTDSVFFKFNLTNENNEPITGTKGLELTIKLAKEAGELATKFLKKPHDFEYEKTFDPFMLLSKKRYVGILYEEDLNISKRKSMGIVLKRRDNAPIVKDIYGGVIDILMKDKNIENAVKFVKESLKNIIDQKYPIEKLIITKSLRGNYKNPKSIAHKVLAERIGKRDPGNKPNIGDRIPYVYIKNPDKKALQGDKIETPEFIIENNLDIDYSHYITNQIMKPLQQVFSLVLENLNDFRKKKGYTLRKWYDELEKLKEKYPNEIQYKQKEDQLRNKEVKTLIFDEFISKL